MSTDKQRQSSQSRHRRSVGQYDLFDRNNPNGKLTTAAVRNDFFDAVRELTPKVLEDLGNAPLKALQAAHAEVPIIDAQLPNWAFIRTTAEDFPSVRVFHDELTAWAARWNLEAEWCLTTAFQTLCDWIERPRLKDELIFSRLNIAAARSRKDIEPPEALEIAPWFPTIQTRRAYEEYVDAALSKGRLSLLDPTLAKKARKTLKPHAEDYCDRVEEHAKKDEKQLKPVTPAQRLISYASHIRWAARVRTTGKDPETIAEEFQHIAEEEEHNVEAIKKAVRAILMLLELPQAPTFKTGKGRPKGRKDSPRSPRQLTKR